MGRLGVAEAQAQIKAAFDAGVNFIDTADVYSKGESEKIVGEAMANLAVKNLVAALTTGNPPNRVNRL